MKKYPDISKIFEEYKDKIYRLAITILKNEKDAEDVLQAVFLKIIENISNFKGKAKLSSWIYKIALNEALMKIRSRKHYEPVYDVEQENERYGYLASLRDKSLLPDEEVVQREFESRLKNTISEMPIKYRLALLLKEIEGFSDKEASKILRLKLNSFKTRLHRARLMIKETVLDYMKDKKAKPPSLLEKRCAIYMGFVNKYIYDDLPKKQKTYFKSHIRDCSECNEFLNSYQNALKITNALQCKDIPPILKEKIESFIYR